MSQKYFITGASGGLGIELVKTVLNAGNTVVAAVRRPEALADLAAQSGGRLIAEKLDVTQIGEIAAVAARHQDTDVLINNAGGAILGAQKASAMPIKRPCVSFSPKMAKEAAIGRKSDSRCAASDFTMPARSTARPITTNTAGSNTPSAANSHQVGK